MADFTAKEMRKLANLMENAIQGDVIGEEHVDHRSEEAKHEQKDVARMIYQIVLKNNDGGDFKDLVFDMTGHSNIRGLEQLLDDEWIRSYGGLLKEHRMVERYLRNIQDRVLPYCDTDDENLEYFDYLIVSEVPNTFKELIDMLELYIAMARQHENEGGPSGEHSSIKASLRYIKLLDTLPLL